MKAFTIRIFWGGARKEDAEAAFGKAFPAGSHLFFCWKRGGWKDSHTWRETLWACWVRPEGSDMDRVVFMGLAERYGKRRGDKGQIERMAAWTHRIDTNRGKGGFNASKEIERTAAKYESVGMPLEVAQGYMYALTRIVELERRWAGEVADSEPMPWEEQSDSELGEGQPDTHGISTEIRGSVN